MSPSAFTRINLAACLAALALLLFLFIYPRMVLTELSDRICAGANELIGMIEAGDWAEANAGINAVNDAFQEKKERLKLFLDHEDLDVVSDFLVMAATLLDIKSRMLLPKVEKEEEEDEEDPRAELVRRLLEYKMYKYMAQELEEREQEAELLFFKEPTIPREVAKYEEPLDLDKLLDGLTLAKLQKVFDAVMKRNANKLDPVRSRFSTIRREPISLEQKVRSVLSYAREHRHFKFSDVLERESDRLEIVVAFLAVLELMKMGRIHLVQEKLFDEMQLDTVDVDETEDEAELELSTEEGEEYARIR